MASKRHRKRCRGPHVLRSASTSNASLPCCLLPLDSSENAVHEFGPVVGCVPLRECDRLIDRDLGRHLAAVELADCNTECAALDDTEAVCSPSIRGGGDAFVELCRMRGGF